MHQLNFLSDSLLLKYQKSFASNFLSVHTTYYGGIIFRLGVMRVLSKAHMVSEVCATAVARVTFLTTSHFGSVLTALRQLLNKRKYSATVLGTIAATAASINSGNQ